jgi:hypothetical protein
MKKSVVFLFITIIALTLSEYILPNIPKTKNVNIALGKPTTFSAKIFPSDVTDARALEGKTLSNLVIRICILLRREIVYSQ